MLTLTDEIDPGQANVVSSFALHGVFPLTIDQAIDPNITAFVGPIHNGKLLHYVGWADQLISAGDSVRYYESVYRFMTEHTEMDIDDFYRLFPVGGMQHWYALHL